MIFVDARCPVQSCPHNHGGDGCSCGFAGYNAACAHPRFKVEWWDRTGGIVPSVDAARSLTARASAASRATVELTAAEAARKALQLELELMEVCK